MMSRSRRTGWPGRSPCSGWVHRDRLSGERQPDRTVRPHRLVEIDDRRDAGSLRTVDLDMLGSHAEQDRRPSFAGTAPS